MLPKLASQNNSSNLSAASDQSQEPESSFGCYVAAKSGALGFYKLRIVEKALQIVAQKSEKVKSSTPLLDFHIKKDQKKPRQESDASKVTKDDST